MCGVSKYENQDASYKLLFIVPKSGIHAVFYRISINIVAVGKKKPSCDNFIFLSLF